MSFLEVPEWFGAGVLAAGLAAIGFVSKNLVELIQEVRATRRARFAKLVHLRPLLRASRVSFVVQSQWRDQLVDSLKARFPEAKDTSSGYEAVFERLVLEMDEIEHALHTQIRGVTIHYLYPINLALLEWVRTDTFFKGHASGKYRELSSPLADLEVHLLTWIAHYNSWIPEQPSHALVYVGDELKRGVPFPPNLDDAVEAVLGNARRGY